MAAETRTARRGHETAARGHSRGARPGAQEGKGNALTRKVGPLPVIVWAALAIGLYLLVRSRSSSSSTPTPSATDTTGAAGTGASADGATGGGTGGTQGMSDQGQSAYDLLAALLASQQPAPAASDGTQTATPTNTQAQPAPGTTTPAATPPTGGLGTYVVNSPSSASLPVANLKANAPIPGTLSHPEAGKRSAPILNTPTTSNIHRPGFQLT